MLFPRSSRIDDRQGWSLVEMMIVIALIGVVATFAVPTFQNYVRNQNLKTAAQEISSDFFINRERALAEGKTYRIVFDDVGNQYTIDERTALGPPVVYTTLQTKRIAASATATDGIVIDTSAANTLIFTFQSRGTISSGTLNLKNAIDSKAVITVNFPSKTYVVYNLK
jgi:type II secretion system protein H